MPREPKAEKIRWGLWLRAAAGCAVLVAGAVAVNYVRHFLLTDARFRLPPPQYGASLDREGQGLSVHGAVYSSRSRIQQAFAADFGSSIFHLPLAERRRRLLAIDWVEDASLMRVWPNRVIAEIRERKPVAFVNLQIGSSGQSRFALIDADGVLLSPPAKTRFHFPVISGITEEQSEADRRDRVRAMLRTLIEIGPAAASSVSEINMSSIEDVRLITQIEGRAIELWMGDQNFAQRYQNFVTNYPEIRKSSGDVSVFDLRMDNRIITK